MSERIEGEDGRRGAVLRIVGWGGVALLLLLPLVTGAPWTLSDYVFAGGMLGGAGFVLELAARASGSRYYRAGAVVAVAASVLLVWVNGAVGFLGDEDEPANLMFAGVLALAVLGSVVARFRAGGMARAMFAATAAQVAIAVIAVAAGLGSPGPAGLYEAVLGTGVFAALWLAAGGLFLRAASEAR